MSDIKCLLITKAFPFQSPVPSVTVPIQGTVTSIFSSVFAVWMGKIKGTVNFQLAAN
jgi:hypothetical protein